MLSFSYRFNTFGKGSKNSNRGEFGGPADSADQAMAEAVPLVDNS